MQYVATRNRYESNGEVTHFIAIMSKGSVGVTVTGPASIVFRHVVEAWCGHVTLETDDVRETRTLSRDMVTISTIRISSNGVTHTLCQIYFKCTNTKPQQNHLTAKMNTL